MEKPKTPMADKHQAAVARELTRSANALWARLNDPWVLLLVVIAVLASFSLPRPQPQPGICLASSSVPSRFHITPYAMPGPIPFYNLSLEAQNHFTLDGQIPVYAWLRQDKGTSQPVWTESLISSMKALADARKHEVERRLCPYGPACNKAFFEALEVHSISGQNVLVVGSITPWLETICLSFGANTTMTVDFTTPSVLHPRVKSMTISQLDASEEVFDSVFSYSSLEHDGLGRYGDPLNPSGDVERMKKLMGLLKPGGKLFLGVPNGPDFLFFNGHRVYGPIRFPKLIEGWRVLGTYGDILDQAYKGDFQVTPDCVPKGMPGKLGCYTQPVHVLQLE